jgi:cytochrome b subunit of formate dehydrogenase
VEKSVSTIRTIPRFTIGQIWEHWILLLSVGVLILTGLPQRYRATTWSQQILTTPERLYLIQNIHRIAAILLTVLVIYHLLRALSLLSRRRLPGDMLPLKMSSAFQWGHHFSHQFETKVCKYNFEQKFTYWFLLFSIGIRHTCFIWVPILSRVCWRIIPVQNCLHYAIVTFFYVIWHFIMCI